MLLRSYTLLLIYAFTPYLQLNISSTWIYFCFTVESVCFLSQSTGNFYCQWFSYVLVSYFYFKRKGCNFRFHFRFNFCAFTM